MFGYGGYSGYSYGGYSGYGCGCGYGGCGNWYGIVLVLFILLVIIVGSRRFI